VPFKPGRNENATCKTVHASASVIITLIVLVGGCSSPALSADLTVSVNTATLPAIGTVDKRFQSFNTEMLEVTGGRFWKPYKDVKPGSTAAGPGADLYEYRPPIDLTRARLRKLAAALGPAYLRVSGTWANTTYFQDSDGPAPSAPPKGFNGVLTRQQWKTVVDFARAANAELMVSFATSDGTRDALGIWTPEQARAFLSYTKSVGGRIAAAEFMNEPDVADRGGAPKGYDAAGYARDIAVFRAFLKQAAPDILFVGPGSVMEGGKVPIPLNPALRSEKLLEASGPAYDVFSYHLYAALSQRCAGEMPALGTTAAAALSEDWLARPDGVHQYYAGLRDRFEPGKPMWLTETADTGCGGNPWASTFLDTFRYVDQHARLAQKGVQVIAHNTLAASDYGLLDETTLEPRPNYWAALLWRKLMGTTVLRPTASPADGLHLYAHCMSGVEGGVTVLAINTDRSNPHMLAIPGSSERYTLTAPNLEDTHVQLNGKELRLGSEDSIPEIAGISTASEPIALPPASITFLAIRQAHNAGCH
jgi:heparanase